MKQNFKIQITKFIDCHELMNHNGFYEGEIYTATWKSSNPNTQKEGFLIRNKDGKQLTVYESEFERV